MLEIIKNQISESIKAKDILLQNSQTLETILECGKQIINSLESGGKLLIAGNGGSAADSQHLAAELISRFYKERKSLSAIALTADTSILSAIGNDYGFDFVFSRQIEGVGKKGDVFLPISTSGNSKNIIYAIEMAKKMGIFVIGLTGESRCKMDSLCDLIIKIPSTDTPRIQESHIMVGHILCFLVEEHFFKGK